MATDRFEVIISELSTLTNIELAPDENETCLIRFNSGLGIQMEIDPSGEKFLIAAELGVVPVGKYRENLFISALTFNGLPHPRYGIFAFSKNTDSLILHDNLELDPITGETLLEYLQPFSTKAEKWRNAIINGSIPNADLESRETDQLSGLFGLTP